MRSAELPRDGGVLCAAGQKRHRCHLAATLQVGTSSLEGARFAQLYKLLLAILQFIGLPLLHYLKTLYS